MITGQQSDFINKVAKKVQELAPSYNIKVISPIIAQAIIESNWGTSGLATKGKNLFGIKCGSSWTGASINMETKEEYTPGTQTNIRAYFRKYDSWDDSIVDYFKFISTKRYAALKDANTPLEYCVAIKDAGYATSSTYVNTLMSAIQKYTLTIYDSPVVVNNETTNNISLVTDYETIVQDVIDGKYSTGDDRIFRLAKAGLNPMAIQYMVNLQIKINDLTNKYDQLYNIVNTIKEVFEDDV